MMHVCPLLWSRVQESRLGHVLFGLCDSDAARRPGADRSGDPRPEAAAFGQSRTVMERLDSLNNLPADEWRFHAGDVAHGEAVDLDDSSWQLVKPKSDAPNEAVWYRRTIEVPRTLNGYDLTGARIWFQFVAERERADAGNRVLQWAPRGTGRRSRAHRFIRRCEAGRKDPGRCQAAAHGRSEAV